MLILGILDGAVGIGQGLGLVQWPASSFMIDQRPWYARGIACGGWPRLGRGIAPASLTAHLVRDQAHAVTPASAF